MVNIFQSDRPLSLLLIQRLPSLSSLLVLLTEAVVVSVRSRSEEELAPCRWAKRLEIPGLRRIAGNERGIGLSLAGGLLSKVSAIANVGGQDANVND